MTYNLNRIQCFDNQNYFPRVILKSLVHTCGVSVTTSQLVEREREILNYVKNFKREVNANFEKIDDNNGLLKIADFIGNQKGWRNKDQLITALKHIIIFNDSLDISPSIKDDIFKINYKNSDGIHNCDPIMAYKYCLEKNIQIDKDDEIEDIERKINQYLNREKENKIVEEELFKVNEEKFEQVKVEQEEKYRERIEELEKKLRGYDGLEEKVRSEMENMKSEYEGKLSTYRSNKDYSDLANLYSMSNLRTKELTQRLEDKEREFSNRLNEQEREYREKIIDKEREFSNKLMDKEREYNDKEIDLLNKINEKNSSSSPPSLLELHKPSHQKIDRFLKDDNSKYVHLDDIFNYQKQTILNWIIERTLLTKEEAIFLGLRIFAFDLRESPYAYDDLLCLNQARKENTNFIPNPERKDFFAINLNQNKNYYSLDRYYFRELKDFYTPKVWNDLYDENNIEDKNLEKLERIFSTPNFHRGWLKGQEMKTYENKNIISFGILKTNIMTFEVEELTEFFKSRGPVNPLDNSKLTPEQLERLNHICTKLGYQNILNSLEFRELKDNEDIQNFISKYLFASDLIDRILDDIFRIGMFIRGWRLDGSTNLTYPLQKKECLSYEDRKVEIKENIERVVRDLNYNIDKIKDVSIKNTFKRLPLVDYIANEFTYSKNEGKMEDLLSALSDLDNTDVSKLSNGFLLASYYYSSVTSYKNLFSINTLELL